MKLGIAAIALIAFPVRIPSSVPANGSGANPVPALRHVKLFMSRLPSLPIKTGEEKYELIIDIDIWDIVH